MIEPYFINSKMGRSVIILGEVNIWNVYLL
jgi:hypothetical protein